MPHASGPATQVHIKDAGNTSKVTHTHYWTAQNVWLNGKHHKSNKATTNPIKY